MAELPVFNSSMCRELIFSHNAEPYVANSMLSPVQNKKIAELKQTNLFSLAIHPTIGKVRITSESEIGHSVEENMIPLYTALQVYAPIHGIFAIKPMAGWDMFYKKSQITNIAGHGQCRLLQN